MKNILIAGGSGLVGTRLKEKLTQKGYEVRTLSRAKKDNNTFEWDIDKQTIDANALTNVNYIINLSGAGIADKRWSSKRKKQIIESRVKSGRILFNAIKNNPHKPEGFITSSAIGYYGTVTSEKIFEESNPAAKDFLGQTCKQWEAITTDFNGLGIRSVAIRTGVVLSKKGGALPKIELPIKLGLGASLGSGKQYMPWIHLDDLCNIYISAIENREMEGAYNAVAPEHISNKSLTKKIALNLKKSIWLPNIPHWVLKGIYGDVAALLLYGSRVSCNKVISSGYTFLFPKVDDALKNLN